MPSEKHGPPRTIDADGTPVRLSSPDKPVFPGVTKAEVLDYYLDVGDSLLEQVAGRPTALERWPDGVFPDVEHFYQKHLPKSAPDLRPRDPGAIPERATRGAAGSLDACGRGVGRPDGHDHLPCLAGHR